jgi:hypothetical protein
MAQKVSEIKIPLGNNATSRIDNGMPMEKAVILIAMVEFLVRIFHGPFQDRTTRKSLEFFIDRGERFRNNGCPPLNVAWPDIYYGYSNQQKTQGDT